MTNLKAVADSWMTLVALDQIDAKREGQLKNGWGRRFFVKKYHYVALKKDNSFEVRTLNTISYYFRKYFDVFGIFYGNTHYKKIIKAILNAENSQKSLKKDPIIQKFKKIFEHRWVKVLIENSQNEQSSNTSKEESRVSKKSGKHVSKNSDNKILQRPGPSQEESLHNTIGENPETGENPEMGIGERKKNFKGTLTVQYRKTVDKESSPFLWVERFTKFLETKMSERGSKKNIHLIFGSGQSRALSTIQPDEKAPYKEGKRVIYVFLDLSRSYQGSRWVEKKANSDHDLLIITHDEWSSLQPDFQALYTEISEYIFPKPNNRK